MVYADYGATRELVEIDTNYKATRPGEHPVRLTRADAVEFAAAVLEATEDTFHYNRCGQLHRSEAAELLKALRAVEFKLSDLHEHAEFDLFEGTGLGDANSGEPTQPAADPILAWRGSSPVSSPVPTFDQQLSHAIAELFPAADGG